MAENGRRLLEPKRTTPMSARLKTEASPLAVANTLILLVSGKTTARRIAGSEYLQFAIQKTAPHSAKPKAEYPILPLSDANGPQSAKPKAEASF